MTPLQPSSAAPARSPSGTAPRAALPAGAFLPGARRVVGALVALTVCLVAGAAPAAAQSGAFTRADTLRGSPGPERSWWDVTFYDLEVAIDPERRTIRGSNTITFRVVGELPSSREMQIDLQPPLVLDSVVMDGTRLPLRNEGAAWFATLPAPPVRGTVRSATAWYGGAPLAAENPPWDGGFIWAEDRAGQPWVATANQGLGASVWWPNKDWQGEEPDSQRIALRVPDPMINVSNGQLRSVTSHDDGTSTWEWFVTSPINNYGVAVNAGSYAHWHEVYHGLDGPLELEFWPLAENVDTARAHWPGQTRSMLGCFEEWFGPYPWYADGFKLVEVPYLGMEHQSAVAYGNGYQNGYLGRDRSGTGQGLGWDFIIVHEAAHEWWGNSLTTEDVADMWVHEGFATLAEGIYVECFAGSAAAGEEYLVGTRPIIRNDRPIIGNYGVQDQGSSDMYNKGGNLLHMIRRIVNDDTLWKEVLRGLQAEFRHSIVTSAQVEARIAEQTGLALGPVFDTYLRTTQLPVFEWSREGSTLRYRWSGVADDFVMPVELEVGDEHRLRLQATTRWQSVALPVDSPDPVVDRGWYVQMSPAPARGG